jgi:hypothetical protein
MSDQPTEVPTPAIAPDPAPAPPPAGWSRRLWSVLLILICFELGLFLLIYPWTDSWSENYFAWVVRGSVQSTWHSLWDNSYVRGCISGMGLVNIWIAVAEVFRLFARRGGNRSKTMQS